MNESFVKPDSETLVKVDAPSMAPSGDLPPPARKPIRPEPPLASGSSINTRPVRQPQSAFLAIREDVERRSREWIATAHLVEQSRNYLATAEAERDFGYKTLAEVLPLVEESGRDLKEAMNRAKDGEDVGNIESLFEASDRALECLERVASDLSAQLVWCRTAWEQFEKAHQKEKKLREEVVGSGR